MADRWTLSGACALVTGGSKGLGYAIADEFVALGARVLLVARGADELAAAAAKLEAGSAAGTEKRVFTVTADLSTTTGREAAVAAASDAFGGVLDILVNNAGVNVRKPTEAVTAEEYTRMIETNQTSAYFMCQASRARLARRSAAYSRQYTAMRSCACRCCAARRGARAWSTSQAPRACARRAPACRTQ